MSEKQAHQLPSHLRNGEVGFISPKAFRLTLAEIGIPRNQLHRWQRTIIGANISAMERLEMYREEDALVEHNGVIYFKPEYRAVALTS